MKKQLAILFALLLVAISVRVLTLQFMRAHLHDPAWFQTGSYAKFDRQARDILDGRQKLFWIDDATRTDLVQYPPAFPALVALIYKVTGDTFGLFSSTGVVGCRCGVVVVADHGYCRKCFRLARCDRERLSRCPLATVRNVRRISFSGRSRYLVCARRQLAIAAGAATPECAAGDWCGCVARRCVLVSC